MTSFFGLVLRFGLNFKKVKSLYVFHYSNIQVVIMKLINTAKLTEKKLRSVAPHNICHVN